MLVPHAFATHFARTVELFRDPQAKTAQKAQFRALLVLLKHDAVTLKRGGGTVTVNGTVVDGAAFEPIRQQLERHSVGELTIPANPPPDQVFQLLTALAGEPGAATFPRGSAPAAPSGSRSPWRAWSIAARSRWRSGAPGRRAKLAQHIDLALRSNKIERALKLTAGLLRCEQAVPEGSRRQYAIALKRMFTRGLLEGVAHLTQLAGHQADAVAVLRRAGASGVEVLLDQLVASPSLEG